MTPLTQFSLAQHSGEYSSWPLTSELLRDGHPSGRQIPGYVLEAQYACGELYLLATSWDCPYEDTLSLVLLNRDLHIVAQDSIGAPYATVWLQSHQPVADNAVLFRCDDELDLLVTLQAPAGLQLRKMQRR